MVDSSYKKVPVDLGNDNQITLRLLVHRVMNYMARTKHYDLKLKGIIDHENHNIINFGYIPTNGNAADVFTNALSGAKSSSIVTQVSGRETVYRGKSMIIGCKKEEEGNGSEKADIKNVGAWSVKKEGEVKRG